MEEELGNLEPYVYEPLPFKSQQHIRVIRLFSGVHGDTIKFELVIKQLPCDVASYEAVSYVWGDTNIKIPAICQAHDGSERLLLVGQNLHDALLRFRYADEERLLWADACCINQEDKAELSQQVAMMRSIYWSAKGVLVWLGPDNEAEAMEAVSLVVDLFYALKALCRDRVRENGRPLVPNLRGFPEVELDMTDFEEDDVANFHKTLDTDLRDEIQGLRYSNAMSVWNTEQSWSTFERYLSATWFSRLWVLQEVQANPNVTIHCGGTSVPLICILTAVTCQMNWWAMIDKPSEHRSISRVIPAANMILKPMDNRGFNALQVMSLVNGLDATNHRDRVYGLLGLPAFKQFNDPKTGGSGAEKVVTIDYSNSVAEVYTDWTIAAMSVYGGLRPLAFVGAETRESLLPREDTRSLPSWVQDLTKHSTGGMGMTYDLWSAAGGAMEDVLIDAEKKTLTVKGGAIGTIMRTHKILDDAGALDIAVIRDLITGQRQWKWNDTSDLRDREWLLPIACSLTGGMTWDRKRAIDDSRKALEDFAAFCHMYLAPNAPGLAEQSGDAAAYRRTILEDMRDKIVFELIDGTIGSCENKARICDHVCVVRGSKVPLVLSMDDEEVITLLCPAYAHGWMMGRMEGIWGKLPSIHQFIVH